MMERDENILVIKKDCLDNRRCGTCANRLVSGYCGVPNTYVDDDDTPEKYKCIDYSKKDDKD